MFQILLLSDCNKFRQLAERLRSRRYQQVGCENHNQNVRRLFEQPRGNFPMRKSETNAMCDRNTRYDERRNGGR